MNIKEERSAQTFPKMENPQPLKEGYLEKRSHNFLQVWKKKRVELTRSALTLCASGSKHREVLPFESVRTLDCVEHRGRYCYFTLVMANGKELDFRSPAEMAWGAEITLALVRHKNEQAVRVRGGRDPSKRRSDLPVGPEMVTSAT